MKPYRPIQTIRFDTHPRLVDTLFVLGLSVFLAGNIIGETTETIANSLSLKDCFRLALEHNLDVKIERYNPEIAQYNVRLAYAGYDPTFNVGGTHGFNLSPGGIDAQNRPFPGTSTDMDNFNSGLTGLLPLGLAYSLGGNLANSQGIAPTGPFENTGGSASIQLRQPLLKNFWIDQTRMTILVNKKLLRISELSLRQQVMNTITSVEVAYYDLILAKENVNVQEEALRLAEQLLAENKHRVEAGALAPLDEKQAESQVAASRAEVLTAQRLLAAQQNALKVLFLEDTTAWESVAPDPIEPLVAIPETLDRRKSWQTGFSMRPDLLQMRVDLERQGVVLRFLRNQMFPQVDLVGSYGHNASKPNYSGALDDLRTGNSPFYSYGAVLTMPLGNISARNNYKVAKANERQALLRLKQLELRAMEQIDDAVKLAQTTFKRVEATKQARAFAEVALQAEQKRLQTGKSTSFVVLQLQRDLTAARLVEKQALADYNKALAQLALSEGSTLERNKVNIEIK